MRLHVLSILATFAVTTDERSRAHTGLSGLIESVNDLGWTPLVRYEDHETRLGLALERGLTMLAERQEPPQRETIIQQLQDSPPPPEAQQLLLRLSRMNPTEQEKAVMRRTITATLAREPAWSGNRGFLELLSQLSPCAGDLANAAAWQVSMSPHLLATVRRNSTVHSWLAVVPRLEGLCLRRSGPPSSHLPAHPNRPCRRRLCGGVQPGRAAAGQRQRRQDGPLVGAHHGSR